MPSYSPVFSQSFIVDQGGAGYSSFLVPDGFTAVIRDFSAYSAAGGFVAKVSIQDSLIALPVVTCYVGATGIPAYGQWQGRVMVAAGGEITVQLVTFIDQPDVYVGGYLLRNTLS